MGTRLTVIISKVYKCCTPENNKILYVDNNFKINLRK